MLAMRWIKESSQMLCDGKDVCVSKEHIRRFISDVFLELAPGMYFTIRRELKTLPDLIASRPREAYERLCRILGGESAIKFFDKIVATHICIKTGRRLYSDKVFYALKEGDLTTFLHAVKEYSLAY